MRAFSLIENPPYRIIYSLEKQALSFAILNKVSHGPIIIQFSTIEFGLRGQPGGFYEEGGAKEARGLVKEGG